MAKNLNNLPPHEKIAGLRDLIVNFRQHASALHTLF